ncbi:MAG: GNAT family N-acetyltransferase [Actinobacteria bacterium]|nr:GNAT family N-acetyltransferase [Actinomycetota bacterium]
MSDTPLSGQAVTGEVLLRDVREADVATFFEQQLDPLANRMAALPPRDRATFEAHWARILSDETVALQTILYDGLVAGNIVGFDGDGERLVGYWIGRDYWGKGIATSALSKFLSREAARPLRARVAKENVGSIRVLEKCGFTRVGEGEADGVEEFVLELREPPGPR